MAIAWSGVKLGGLKTLLLLAPSMSHPGALDSSHT